MQEITFSVLGLEWITFTSAGLWIQQSTQAAELTSDLQLMTHSPDFGAESRRRLPDCVIPIWYQIFLVPDSGAGRLRVLFRAYVWYARDR